MVLVRTPAVSAQVTLDDIVGESSAMAAVRERIAQAAPTDSRVLITEPEFADDDAARAEADQMQARADEIFQRLRISVADRSGPHPAQTG